MKDGRSYIRFIDSCQIKDRIYFMNHTFSGMFYLDTKDCSIHFVHRFSNGQDYALSLSSTSLVYENTIYFFPAKADAIMAYDLIKQQEIIIPIQDFHGVNCLIGGIVRLGNKVYMFPADLGRGIYVFYLEERRIKKEAVLSKLFESGFPCGNIFQLNNNCVLLCMGGGNQVVEVNLSTKKIIYTKSFEEDMKFYSVCFDGKNYWFLQEGSTDIYEWNKEEDTLQLYKNENVEWGVKQSIPYSNMVFLENEILVLNCHLKNILRINKEKKTIADPVLFPEGFQIVKNKFPGRSICEHYTILEDKVLLYPGNGNMLLIYDKVTHQMTGKDISVSPEEDNALREVLKERFMGKKLFVERNDLWSTLEYYINIIKSDRSSDPISLLDTEKIGQVIYQNCHAL